MYVKSKLSKKLFQGDKSSYRDIAIWLSSLIYLPIKPACCYVRYLQLAYGGMNSPTHLSVHDHDMMRLLIWEASL